MVWSRHTSLYPGGSYSPVAVKENKKKTKHSIITLHLYLLTLLLAPACSFLRVSGNEKESFFGSVGTLLKRNFNISVILTSMKWRMATYWLFLLVSVLLYITAPSLTSFDGKRSLDQFAAHCPALFPSSKGSQSE